MSTMVIAPHPDDETLGCGGTLLRRKKNNEKLAWVIVTSPSEVLNWSEKQKEKRNIEIKEVSQSYGFDETYHFNFPSSLIDTIPKAQLIDKFSEVINEFLPSEILIPSIQDSHSDHKIIFECIASCLKWFRFPSIKRALAYETISETDFGFSKEAFRANFFVDITEQLETKLEILSIYESEIGSHPFPRSLDSVRALALLRGSSSGFEYAEAFELLKEIT